MLLLLLPCCPGDACDLLCQHLFAPISLLLLVPPPLPALVLLLPVVAASAGIAADVAVQLPEAHLAGVLLLLLLFNLSSISQSACI